MGKKIDEVTESGLSGLIREREEDIKKRGKKREVEADAK